MVRKQKWRELIQLAWPLIIANSFWNLQLTIDRVYLGNFSTEALGAAMTVMGVFWTPMALLQQTSNYVTTFVAQYFGGKNYAMIGPSIWQAIYVSVIGGLLFLLFNLVSPTFFASLGHSKTVTALEIEYFNSISFSALPTALVAAFSGFLIGLGETKKVMWINGVGLITNALFDYLLIFGNLNFPAMGISGAGYATALAGWASAIFGFVIVFKHSAQTYNLWSGWHWNWSLLKRFLRYGLPSGLQWSLEGLAFTIFLIVMGTFPNGDASLASSSIAVTIMMISVLPAMGLAQAVMVLVGQHLGDKTPDLAEEFTWCGVQLSMIYMTVIGISFILIPEFYLSWFKNEKNFTLWSQVQQIVPYLLMFIATFTLFDALNFNFSFALKGAGDTRFVSLVALILPWPLMVIPTYLMKDWHGAVFYAWGAATVYVILLAMTFWQRFEGGKWKTMTVTGN